MSDLISRQAAIDELMKRDKALRNINWYDKPFAEGECKGIDDALEIINALPPAQPEGIKYVELSEEDYEKLAEQMRKNSLILTSAQPEQKKGKWIDETFKPWGLVHHPYKCDQCGEHSECNSKYCPHCGAKMEE